MLVVRSFPSLLSLGALALVAAAGACSIANAPDDPIDPGPSSSSAGGDGGMGGSGGAEAICGDGVTNGSEECDDAGESAECNSDCTEAACGDSILNSTAGEECDQGGETANCNDDCTVVQCGDDITNVTAGEQCDDSAAFAAGCCNANTCDFSLNCNAPTTITLTDNGNGQAVGSAMCPLGGMAEIPDAPCDGNPAIGSGPEQVYQFNLAQPSSVNINVNSDFDAVIRLMTSACDVTTEVPETLGADGCSNQSGANGVESLSYNALTPGNYFLIVEGAGPQEVGQFDVQVTTEPLTNPIVNPSFETQNYQGWTLIQSTVDIDFTIMLVQPMGPVNPNQQYIDLFDNQSASSGSPSLPFTVNPSDGQFAAVWLSDGPDNRRMYQDLVVTGGTLTFDMAHFNSDSTWIAGVQQIAINIRNPQTDAILATPFVTAGSFPVTSPTMTTYSVNIAGFMGQTVRLDVEVIGQDFYLDAVFDNFLIQ